MAGSWANRALDNQQLRGLVPCFGVTEMCTRSMSSVAGTRRTPWRDTAVARSRSTTRVWWRSRGGDADQDRFLVRSFLWNAGALTRLRGTLTGGYSRVTAVNERGTAVGTSLSSDGYTGWPVRWRDGTAEDLSVPPRGDLPSPATPEAINSRGLIVGHVTGDQALHPWIWRPGGSAHPLRGLHGQRVTSGRATDVDDRGRIVGWLYRPDGTVPISVFWPGRRQQAHRLDRAYGPVATSGQRNLVGFANRRPYRGFVRHFDAEGVPRLLPLPEAVPRGRTLANDVVRGASWLAPCGGVTAIGESGLARSQATVWTRAYRQPQPSHQPGAR